MAYDPELVYKLLLAMALGGVVGIERELRSKSAGFRTLILICLGAAMFTIFSQYLGGKGSPDRIASNVVVGIGFIGAGVIFKGDKVVNGITTAASIWLTAAVGVGVGCGYYFLAILGCFLVLITLFLLSTLDNYLDRLNQIREYIIEYAYEEHNQHKYEKMISKHGLTIKARSQKKQGNMLRGTWIVIGKESRHHKFIEMILKDTAVIDFEF
jgi:putative Mg2+ transporter-C (MgtC) family protein